MKIEPVGQLQHARYDNYLVWVKHYNYQNDSDAWSENVVGQNLPSPERHRQLDPDPGFYAAYELSWDYNTWSEVVFAARPYALHRLAGRMGFHENQSFFIDVPREPQC